MLGIKFAAAGEWYAPWSSGACPAAWRQPPIRPRRRQQKSSYSRQNINNFCNTCERPALSGFLSSSARRFIDSSAHAAAEMGNLE